MDVGEFVDEETFQNDKAKASKAFGKSYLERGWYGEERRTCPLCRRVFSRNTIVWKFGDKTFARHLAKHNGLHDPSHVFPPDIPPAEMPIMFTNASHLHEVKAPVPEAAPEAKKIACTPPSSRKHVSRSEPVFRGRGRSRRGRGRRRVVDNTWWNSLFQHSSDADSSDSDKSAVSAVMENLVVARKVQGRENDDMCSTDEEFVRIAKDEDSVLLSPL